MSVYLDASVLVPSVIREPNTDSVDRFIEANSAVLAISDFAAAEVASALSRLVRMNLLEEAGGHAKLTGLDRWRAARVQRVELHPSDVRAADIFVRRFELKLRTPDALHLAICRRLGMTLATLDQRLFAAAAVLNIPAQSP